MTRIALFAAIALLAHGASAPAQSEQPLILEKKKSGVTVKKKSQAEREAEKKKDAAESGAKVAAADDATIVAIVDGRALTRAELDARVRAKYDGLRKELGTGGMGVVATYGADLSVMDPSKPVSPDAQEKEFLADQQRQLENALREEESLSVTAWVEHSLLAEEARRQRIAISESDFRARLAEAEKHEGIDDSVRANVLEQVGMSRQDYERSVYDALLIERLIERFTELNYTEAQLRDVYNLRPETFWEPARHRIAHYSIAFAGNEDRATVSNLKKKAEAVRDALRKGEDPAKLFARSEISDMQMGMLGTLPGWYTFYEGLLPMPVEVPCRKLKAGQTSDVLPVQERDEEGRIQLLSLHVVKVLESEPEKGKTFESALPAIRRSLQEVARTALLERIRASKGHRVIVNLRGIPPEKVPTREELIALESKAQPLNLKMPKAGKS